jgi:hypothetical protein
MKLSKWARSLAMALLIAGPNSVPASAQVQACPCVINSICCQCADGSIKTVDLSTGIAPWRVTVPGSTTSQLVVGGGNSAWTASAPSAQWVVPPGAPQTGGTYVYTLQYNVPNCVIPASVVMTIQAASDDSGGAISVGGPPFATASFFGIGTIPTIIVPPAGTTPPGLHTLTVRVNNQGGTPTGLLAKVTITTRCPFQPPTGTGLATEGPAQE